MQNEEGKVTHITFEVEKHKDFLQPILKDLGIVEKTRFRQDFEKGFTIEEARKDMIEHIEQLYANDPQKEMQIGFQKSKFREDFEKAIPIEESKRKMIEHIRKYYEDKH